MKYLILYAHPNPKSFNHAILKEVEAKLKKEGKKYLVRDLYRLTFNPVLSADDFVAFKSGTTPDDIKTEQNHMQEADVLIIIHPIWWYGMPAILKGYIDRVLSYGFAYSFDENGVHGLLPDKKVVIFNTTGGPREYYAESGFNDALQKTLEDGIFKLCGMKILLHKYFYSVVTIDDAARKKMLEEIQKMSF